MCIASTWVSENLGHANAKNQGIHNLFIKKEGYTLPGGAKKGGYLARTSVLCHI